MEFSNINSGGCGAVAAITGHVVQRMGWKVDIVTAGGYTPSDVRPDVQDKSDLNDWELNGLSIMHLALRVKVGDIVMIWDSDGVYLNSRMFGLDDFWSSTEKFGEGLTVEECSDISECKGWNHMFDRSQLPAIADTVSSVLLGKNVKTLRRCI